MKKFNCVLVLSLALMLIVGCAKDNLFTPADDQETISLKSAEVKRPFEGVCTFVSPIPNTWYDATDDWRTTGTTIWEFGVAPEGYDIGGMATLFVDAKNKHDENRGIWEMTWKGIMTPTTNPSGMKIVAEAEGNGVEGKVKGMKANWTYTMNFVGDEFPPTTPNPTFFYVIEGNIDKPQGPIKK